MVALRRTLGLLVVIALYAYILAMAETARRGLLSEVCRFGVGSVAAVAMPAVVDGGYGALAKLSFRAQDEFRLDLDYCSRGVGLDNCCPS